MAAAQEAEAWAKAEAEAIAGPDPVAEAEKAKITAKVMEALSKHISPKADADDEAIAEATPAAAAAKAKPKAKAKCDDDFGFPVKVVKTDAEKAAHKATLDSKHMNSQAFAKTEPEKPDEEQADIML